LLERLNLKGGGNVRARVLHITDGESVAGTLRGSGVHGDVAIYGDLMYEGPAPAGINSDAWRERRSRFLNQAGYATLPDARRYLDAGWDALRSFPRYDEIVIWLDHRLSDQLILILALDWFSCQSLGNCKLSLICPGVYPAVDPFIGLGQLNGDQLLSLLDTRVAVTEARFQIARAAWNAFTSPDPTAIERLLETDTSPLPFLAAAMRRHLEQFPSREGGLSWTELRALFTLREQGTLPARKLFAEVQRSEKLLFMGDASFYRLLMGLASVRNPLVDALGAAAFRTGDRHSSFEQWSSVPVAITESGLRVMEGQADHIRLNGIDRWLGGVHLEGAEAAWRWDAATARLCAGSGQG
jgi:hypothetical protein